MNTSNKPTLTAEELKFSSLVAQGISPTTAFRQSHPSKATKSYGYIRNLAYKLMTKADIKTEIETKVETRARLARLAEDRIEEILVEDSIGYKGSRVADVAMFMYDHANGKATQRIESTSQSITFNVDLTAPSTEVDDVAQ